MVGDCENVEQHFFLYKQLKQKQFVYFYAMSFACCTRMCVPEPVCMLQIANERAGCAGIDEGKGAEERERERFVRRRINVPYNRRCTQQEEGLVHHTHTQRACHALRCI